MALLLVAACGSEEQISGIDRGGAPTPAAVIASGPITAFGSVVVNGTRYDTSNAQFIIDDAAGSEVELRIGQVVRVRGSIDGDGNAVAEVVEFDAAIEGSVESVDLAAGRLVVLGQTVQVDDGTSFDRDFSPRSLEGISAGEVVEISGFLNADGVTFATRIDRDDDGGDSEVHGFVSNLDQAAGRFGINALTVDYTQAMLEGFPGGQPENGDFVEVEGALAEANVLLANRIERERRGLLDDDDDDDFEADIEGFITRFVSPEDFDVDGQRVSTDAQTSFEDGTAADLALNVKVEVEGDLGTDGVLRADEVEFLPAGVLGIQAPVQAVDPAAGTLTLLGILVRVDENTRFEDQSDDGERILDLADLNVGDGLEVRGYEDPAGSHEVTATLLEREDDDDEVELLGFVETLADPEFFILGVTILTTPETEFDDLGRDEFFAQGEGRLVEVEGQLSGDVLVAEEVELADGGEGGSDDDGDD
jgi:hypothetical protein